ncbi:MAG: exodeoxyribonuclease VII large subunit [Alistipes sp.]|nr:exodeoxyribonuclease VII large subunit [Alistipes sp.]
MSHANNHITLKQLQQQIKSAVEGALPLPVWIVAEVAELKVNYSGHCYMELVEKSESKRGANSTPTAQARAVIWRSQWAMISPYFRQQTGSDLQAGMKILARVMVSYHELYGLSLQILDIDPSYTLGEVERQKQLTIAQLKADGVWDMNRELSMPYLVQRIAVVSSAAAAGYRDFMNELREGGYAFHCDLYDAVVQGNAAEESICAALEEVALKQELYDAVVVIRGGGSASDLSCFNSYRLCSYVAQFPLPVLTGIGHDKDTSVADMVAHTPLKTPTAVAAWLTDRMARIEGWLEDMSVQLKTLATAMTKREELRLERLSAEIKLQAATYCQRAEARLELMREQLFSLVERRLEREKSRLEVMQRSVEALSPKRIMELGFAVVRSGGKVIKRVGDAEVGAPIEVELADGRIKARIEQ